MGSPKRHNDTECRRILLQQIVRCFDVAAHFATPEVMEFLKRIVRTHETEISEAMMQALRETYLANQDQQEQ